MSEQTNLYFFAGDDGNKKKSKKDKKKGATASSSSPPSAKTTPISSAKATPSKTAKNVTVEDVPEDDNLDKVNKNELDSCTGCQVWNSKHIL